MRDDARQREPARSVEIVRYAMQQNGVEARVAQDDFEHAAGGRIAPEDRIELLANVASHVCRILDIVRFTFVALILVLAGCSAPAPTAQPKQAGAPEATTTVISNKHPLAKYLELSGYRIAETAAGKLNIKFAVVNHSEADIGDLTLKIRLVTTAARPEDPPITEFEAKVPALGPQEIKDVSATAATKLRIYELPDWQFIRAEVEITSPAP